MSGRIDPQHWRPVGVSALERAAEDVVRSATHHAVVAGPGAGKTELLAQRACFLLQTGTCRSPRRILAISFKRDAASNLRERVLARCGADLARRFDSFTFDAFAKGLLDRFQGALPTSFSLPHGFEPSLDAGYERELRPFMASVRVPPALGTTADLEAIKTDDFMRDYVLRAPLNAEGWAPPLSAGEWAAQEFWRSRLPKKNTARPTFPMIGRLAELVLRTNPVLLAALRATYGYVFLDEFQDTTHVQYDLLKTAFRGSDAVLTAVGDNRQRIMGFAMALDDAFGRLPTDFPTHTVRLQMNYRSAPELVAIQDVLMRLLDPASVKPVAAPGRALGSGRCDVLAFGDDLAEATFLARLIEFRMRHRGVRPRDICLLVKQKPQDYASRLVPALAARGIKARNEQDHQDLLTEPLVSVVIAMLWQAALVRHGSSWDVVLQAVRAARGDDGEARFTRQLEREIVSFRSEIRRRLPGIRTKAEIHSLLSDIMAFVGVAAFRQLYPQYRRGGFYASTLDGLSAALATSRTGTGTWSAALSDFEGLDAVPIMTIHKSKGLEYDTVIFVGLEDSAFWKFTTQRQDDISAFFVALSRAKERVVFTFSQSRGARLQGRTKIGELYGLLQDAGVVPVAVRNSATAAVE